MRVDMAARLTERPRRLLRGPLIEEEPPRGLEDHVALERRHALVHGRELVRVSSSER